VSDGGNKARLTKESAKETVKTTRAGNAGPIRRTCGDYARVLFSFARETAGALDAPGIPCALDFKGEAWQNPGTSCRGNEESWLLFSLAPFLWGEGRGEGLFSRTELVERPPHPNCSAIRPPPASGAR
jgi:hypothetical protein